MTAEPVAARLAAAGVAVVVLEVLLLVAVQAVVIVEQTGRKRPALALESVMQMLVVCLRRPVQPVVVVEKRNFLQAVEALEVAPVQELAHLKK